MFLRVCRTTSVVLELVFGLLAFPAGSPLAGVGGCSASKTAFTSVNLVNLVGQSLPRVPQSVYWLMAVYASTAINRAVKHSQ